MLVMRPASAPDWAADATLRQHFAAVTTAAVRRPPAPAPEPTQREEEEERTSPHHLHGQQQHQQNRHRQERHHQHQLQQSLEDPLYKTEMCRSYVLNAGKCPYGERCRFAHGEEELRTVSKPSSFRTRKCKFFHENGYCRYGDRCFFLHASSQAPHRDSRWGAEDPDSGLDADEGDHVPLPLGCVCARRLPVFEAIARRR